MDVARVTAIPLFAGLSGPALEAVCVSAGEYRVDAGTTLATEGDFGHGFFAIEAGTADVVREGAPERTSLDCHFPGQVLSQSLLGFERLTPTGRDHSPRPAPLSGDDPP